MSEKCNIRDYELAAALEITLERVYEICQEFDKDPNDDWNLVEGEHFVWSRKAIRQRRFSPEGAYAICKYINEHEGRRLFRRFRRWLNRRDEKLKQLLVEKKFIEVTQDSNSFVISGGKVFLRPPYVRNLLGLGKRQDVLTKAFNEEIKTSNPEPLQLDKHFIEDGSSKYLSGMGISRVAVNLSLKLTKQHRRDWCQLVGERAISALHEVVEDREERVKRVERAKKKAKTAAKNTCQITGLCCSPLNLFDLAVHHVYDQETYPQLADHPFNLLVIRADIHKEFHQWMGGNHVSCTVDDLQRYIETFAASLFPDADGATMAKTLKRLEKIRKMVKPI